MEYTYPAHLLESPRAMAWFIARKYDGSSDKYDYISGSVMKKMANDIENCILDIIKYYKN